MMRRAAWLCLSLVFALFAGGCSQEQAPEPPASYTIGEEDTDTLPALQEAVPLSDEEGSMSFSESTDPDTEETSYTYSGLEKGSEAVSQYVSALENDEDCSVVDEDGMVQQDADLSTDSGSVLVGKEASEGGAMLLKISWNDDSCTISPVYDQELQIQAEPQPEDLTLNQVIDRFESYTPEQLGLPGDKMSDYTVVPEEGYVLVDGNPGFRVNIYEKVSSSFAGSYLISSDGEHVYSLNRSTEQVSELALA